MTHAPTILDRAMPGGGPDLRHWLSDGAEHPRCVNCGRGLNCHPYDPTGWDGGYAHIPCPTAHDPEENPR